jgi:hypothetical protein
MKATIHPGYFPALLPWSVKITREPNFPVHPAGFFLYFPALFFYKVGIHSTTVEVRAAGLLKIILPYLKQGYGSRPSNQKSSINSPV